VVMMSMLSTVMMLSRRSCVVAGRRSSPAFVAGVHRQQQQQIATGVFTVGSNQLQQHQSNQRSSSTWGSSSLLRPQMTTVLSMSTTAEDQEQSVEPSPSSSSSTTSSLVGIDWVREVVATALNDIFDPKEIAKNAATAKLDGKKKKKKNKKKKNVDESAANNKPEEEEQKPKMSEEERNSIIQAAIDAAQPFSTRDAMVTPATKPEFGDYQCNAAMSLAKSAGLNPRECATKIVDQLRPLIQEYMEEPEIAGPGFINFKFKEEYLSQALGVMVTESMGRLGVPEAGDKKKIVVDFSSPNIAKEMHVGHLRSTIIGDTLSNLLTFSGHDVLRLNHVGDWGTQFGMLVEHLRDEFPQALSKETAKDVELGDLVTLYKAAKKRFDADDDFKVRSREGVVKLQAGDKEALAAWESLCAASRVEYQKIYDVLNIVGLNERGESFYNPYLLNVIEDLEGQGLAVESEGATAVFLDGYTNRDGSPLPMLVRKSDGGFNYATTDLAAIRHRVQMETSDGGEKADRVLYVTDAGQSQHFEMVFAAAKKAGFVTDSVSLEHVPFGLVQGEDGKKFATRSGDTVKLKDLLDEAVRIAGEDMKSRMENPDEDFTDAIADVAKTVGIGAVKYADLSMNRESNYKFSYGRMLSLNGNTAPYMLYAYARICGIVRKATDQPDDQKVVWPEANEILITHDSEKQLIRNLIKLPDVLSEVESELYPNRLCDYLFETSQKFNQFYENCSVNNAETPELKASRLSLCTVSAATIRLLMGFIGIDVVERL